jgi:hypothetical protein
LGGEPGWPSCGVGDGPRPVDAVETSGEWRSAITRDACWRARLAGVGRGALGRRGGDGEASARRGAVRWRSGSRPWAAWVAARLGDMGPGVERCGRVGLRGRGLEAVLLGVRLLARAREARWRARSCALAGVCGGGWRNARGVKRVECDAVGSSAGCGRVRSAAAGRLWGSSGEAGRWRLRTYSARLRYWAERRWARGCCQGSGGDGEVRCLSSCMTASDAW